MNDNTIKENTVYKHIYGQKAKVIATAIYTELNQQLVQQLVVYKWLGADGTFAMPVNEFLQRFKFMEE